MRSAVSYQNRVTMALGASLRTIRGVWQARLKRGLQEGEERK